LGPLSVKYNKPNFVGEMGWMQLQGQDTALPQNAGWFNIKWKDLVLKGAANAGCIGGAFFEYMDEVNTKGSNFPRFFLNFERESCGTDTRHREFQSKHFGGLSRYYWKSCYW
jgi:hypothetical protein